jgi:N-carbamoyl-L-amino-acid hydrolase
MPVESALEITDDDGISVGDELDRIGYRGAAPCPGEVPHAFVELHIEQGPVLEREDRTIGVVSSVQGISWTELSIVGQSNHAGTTPMSMRRDPVVVAARLTSFVRQLTEEIGPPQVGTVGALAVHPNLVNVIASELTMTVDLRNTDDPTLADARNAMISFAQEAAAAEDCELRYRTLADSGSVAFDDRMQSIIADRAIELGLDPLAMPSGAGHDAQMFARVCPSGMIFVPSQGGISHNPAEFTESDDLEAGANVLLQTLLTLANER